MKFVGCTTSLIVFGVGRMTYFSRSWASRYSTRGTPLWGDGLVDLNLNTLWYGCSWETVTDDELVFFYPSLVSDKNRADPSIGLVARIRQRMLPIANLVMRHFEADCPSAKLEVLLGTGVATVLSSSATADEISNFDHQSTDTSSLADALCRLATMDWMLNDAQISVGSSDGQPLKIITLPDVLLGTIHGRINGAYVYPSATYAHELLMAGAWLGTVLTGRAALMPTTVAEVLLEYLSDDHPMTDEEQRRINRILYVYSSKAGGRDRLLRIARTTLVKGPQELRAPHGRATTSIFESDVWHPDLARNVEQILYSLEDANRIRPARGLP
jgi:hypothetical protein